MLDSSQFFPGRRKRLYQHSVEEQIPDIDGTMRKEAEPLRKAINNVYCVPGRDFV